MKTQNIVGRNTVQHLILTVTMAAALTASLAAPSLATPPVGDPPPPAIDIQKLTNGVDRDEAPGAILQVGEQVVWTYVITNIGASTLSWVTVADSTGVDITCPGIETLGPGEMMTCAAHVIAEPGPSRSKGLVAATTVDGYVVDDSDPEFYVGEFAKNLSGAASLTIEKLVNGIDADAAPGPSLATGTSLTWLYVISNTGDVPLAGLAVTDSTGAVVTCLGTESLQPGESMSCAASAVVTPGPHRSAASVSAVDPAGGLVDASDPSYHVGI